MIWGKGMRWKERDVDVMERGCKYLRRCSFDCRQRGWEVTKREKDVGLFFCIVMHDCRGVRGKKGKKKK